jgi:sulfate transport system ATP-binding protein
VVVGKNGGVILGAYSLPENDYDGHALEPTLEPRVLLLDEPFGALDAKVRKDLPRWLREFHERLHITTLFVTHDQEEALELADEIVILHQGSIQQIGAPAEILSSPANPFVADFLGLEARQPV